MNELVLVTGGTGFVGSHCILKLLNAGYRVRTTVRSLDRQQEVLDMLKADDVISVAHLSFIEADLMQDENWDEAVRDCKYVLHVASPLTLAIPKHEDEMIRPAVDGTLRVLRAAKKGNVKRVVLTSSFAAIGYGLKPNGQPFTEENWTNLDDHSLSAYVKSKAMAERAAWDFMTQNGGPMELTAINPMAILGPLLGPDLSSGHVLLKGLLDGSIKAVPPIDFGIVDVRDVADLHLRAMVNPNANGQRFLALSGGVVTFHEVAMVLRQHLGENAKKVTTHVMPAWLVRVGALFNDKLNQVVPMMGQERLASNEKAKSLLGWSPRSHEEAVVAAGESLLRYGFINK